MNSYLSKVRVLLIEDNPADARLIEIMLSKAKGISFDLEWVKELSSGIKHLAESRFDLVLLDLSLPNSLGLNTFTTAYARISHTPIVILTGLDDEETALTAIHKGAQDYLIKGEIDSRALTRSIRYALGRNQVEQKLANEKEQLSVTLRSIGDGVITTDTQGKVVLINKVAERLTGYSQEEASGKPISQVFNIINEITGEPCENPAEKVLATGAIVGLANHTALIAKDGTERTIADSGAPIKDRQNQVIGVVLVFRDITRQQKLEEEVRKIQHLDSIGLLAGGIAHDFSYFHLRGGGLEDKMNKTLFATFDGKTLLLEKPLKLRPNTHVKLTIETVKTPKMKRYSFLKTAQSLKLEGPSDWSAHLEKYRP